MKPSAAGVPLSILLVLINWNGENALRGATAAAKATGRLLFEDNFDFYDTNKWSREIKIPQDPDYEFCIFHKHPETVEIGNGFLRIKPSLFEDDYGEDSVFIGQLRLADCSSSIEQECHQQATSFHILPPVISGKVVTRNHFEFRYGVIEVRAKFPEGDWLYPEIWLEPLYKSYDRRFANARIDLGRVRGNAALTREGDASEDYSARLLEFGLGNGTGADYGEALVSQLRPPGISAWNKEWHVYKTTWTARGFTFHVDGQEVGRLVPTESGWASDGDPIGDKMRPFDNKFYLSIGVGVGGIRVFPDDTQTSNYAKPWKNTSAKAMLRFWQAKSKWLPSWERYQGSKTALEIDYVRIWALD